MTQNERVKAYDKFTQVWGKLSQYNQAIEEMAELTQALCKLNRPDLQDKYDEYVKLVQEEIADTLNCVEQLEYMFGHSEIEKLRDYKLNRTLNVIKKDAKF
ncbi:MAG: hypothetical protein IK070_01330 [Clostridia bacterium]|nr:hypothetical protein [Clostridia bacterium]